MRLRRALLGLAALLILPVILLYRACGGHWCQDETNMLLMSIPFVGASWAWLQAKLHHKHAHHNCTHK